MSGLRRANTLSEWQLQAVLYKAKLTQYYDTFISQGGDDIDQIMQCDEQEFLEIMSLVGMASKPLHVRRLQRTLNEFSLNRAQFLMNAIVYIGLPPMDFPCTSTTSTLDSLIAALQFLIPGFLPNQLDFSAVLASGQLDDSIPSTSKVIQRIGTVSSPGPSSSASHPITSSNNMMIGGTANILPFPDSVLMSLVSTASAFQASSIASHNMDSPAHSSIKSEPVSRSGGNISPIILSSSAGGTPQIKTPTSAPTASNMQNQSETQGSSDIGMVPSSSSSMSSAAAGDPASMLSQLFDMPSLSENDVRQLTECALALTSQLPRVEPRLVHNKKKISKELLDAMSLPTSNPRRLAEFRRFSAIYGRFDAKRKPDKPLTFHEALVNEAAAQLAIFRPELLTRRDELFPLARKLVRMAGFRGLRNISHRRRRNRKRSAGGADCAYDSSEHSQSRDSSVGSTSISPSPSPHISQSSGDLPNNGGASGTSTPQPNPQPAMSPNISKRRKAE